MARSSTSTKLYPDTFAATEMDVPEAPNVTFSFVVEAPKAHVMDAWNLPRAHGGDIEVRTDGKPEGAWPGIADDMERVIYVGGVGVTQVVGNLRTPHDGDWHFEWKAGAPYYRMPFPLSLIMKAVHGTATLSDGPGPAQTTVSIENRHRPGLALWFTRLAIKASMPSLSSAAPKRYAAKEFLGPRPTA